MNSSTTIPSVEAHASVLVVGPPAFQEAFRIRFGAEKGALPEFSEASGAMRRIAEGAFAEIVVDVESLDESLTSGLIQSARTGAEIRILSAAALAGRIEPANVANRTLSDAEIVCGEEVGARVSEKVRSRLGSIRLGSEILLSKVRNPRGDLLPDAESLHDEVVDFCDSLGFYLDLRLPGGQQVSGGWTRFDAFEALGVALSHASVKTGCKIHLSGEPGMIVSGFKRDPARLVLETVQNAIVHGFAKNVWLAAGIDDGTGEAMVTIEDDGQGFLYREIADGSFRLRMEGNELRSKGIGVLICRRILSRYQGRMDYVVKRDGGIRVEVRVQANLKKPASNSVLAPIGLRVEE